MYAGVFSDLPDGDDTFSYSTMKERDARRFKMADTNYDDVLSFSEYVDFLHPEDAEHMRDIVVMETIEDIDKDKDGIISESEYIGKESIRPYQSVDLESTYQTILKSISNIVLCLH